MSCGDAAIREFLIGRDFVGVHPWEAEGLDLELSSCPKSSAFVLCLLSSVLPGVAVPGEGQRTEDNRQRQRTLDSRTLDEDFGPWTKRDWLSALCARLTAEPALGIGEIGLDRLKERTVSPKMRAVFVAQLALAAAFRRPVVLHGAKCWGQVVEEIKKLLSGAYKVKEEANASVDCRLSFASVGCPLSSVLPSGRRLGQRTKDIGQRPRTLDSWTLDEDSSTLDFGACAADNRTIPSFLFHGFSRSDGLLSDIVALNGFVSVGPAVLNDHAVNYRALVKKIPLDRLVVETDRTPENAATCPSVVEVAKKVAELRGLSLEELERVTDANAARFAGMGQRGGQRGG